MNKRPKISRLSTYSLLCDNCQFAWVICLGKIKKNYVRPHKSSQSLCQICANYLNEVEKSEDISPIYNPFDLSAWGKRLVQKQFFYCCSCKTDIYKNHKLSQQTSNVLLVYSYRRYPFHSLCGRCFSVYMTVPSKGIPPEFCCKPNNAATLKIVTVTESIVWAPK